EVSQVDLVAFEPLGENQLGVSLKAKFLRHYADHRVGPCVDCQSTAYDGFVSSETALPIAVGEHHGLFRAGSVVGLREPAAQQGLHAYGIQNTVGHKERSRQLGLGDAGNACAGGVPQTELLKGVVLLAIGEVHGGRAVEVVAEDRYSGCGVPDAYQGLG